MASCWRSSSSCRAWAGEPGRLSGIHREVLWPTKLEPRVLPAGPCGGGSCGCGCEAANGALQLLELGLDRRDQLAELDLEGLTFSSSVGSALDKLRAEGLHDGVELANCLAAELFHPVGPQLQLNDASLEVLEVGRLRHEGALEVIDKALKLRILLADRGLNVGGQVGCGPLHVSSPGVELFCEAWDGGRIKDGQELASRRRHHDARQQQICVNPTAALA